MRIIRVKLKEDPYNIVVGSGIINSLGRRLKALDIGTHALIITNKSIKKRYGIILDRALAKAGFETRYRQVADGEQAKSLKTVFSIVSEIARYSRKKKVFILAFGGGVIGDIAGFAASIYRRGISYAQVPTTLLAQVDSSIGGKTAVDLAQGKNLVGAFYQPGLVCSDIDFIKTLDLRQLRNGLAEVVKYAVIKDASLFGYLEKGCRGIFTFDPKVLEHIVWRCSKIKAEIVSRDAKDKKGIRMILNFGHTLGHALEAASGYKGYQHGEAVALGMLLANDISLKQGLMREDTARRIEALIKALGLPVEIRKGISLSRVIRAYYQDKKFSGAKNRMVLASGIGRTRIVEDIPLETVRQVLIQRGHFSGTLLSR